MSRSVEDKVLDVMDDIVMSWWKVPAILLISAVLLIGVICWAVMAFDRSACTKIAQVQNTETFYSWNTGCVYVNPDYEVAS